MRLFLSRSLTLYYRYFLSTNHYRKRSKGNVYKNKKRKNTSNVRKWSLTHLTHPPATQREIPIHTYICMYVCVYMQKANRVFPCWAWYFFVRIYTIVGKCARVYVCLLAWYVYLCDVCFGWYVSWLTTRRRWPDLKRTNELGEKGKRSNRKSVQRNYNDHWHACMYVNVYVCMWLFVR